MRSHATNSIAKFLFSAIIPYKKLQKYDTISTYYDMWLERVITWKLYLLPVERRYTDRNIYHNN